MKLAVVVLLLSGLAIAASLANFSVSNQDATGSFPSLEKAFVETAALDQVELRLLPSPKPFPISTSVFLYRHFRVHGEEQSIELAKTLYVAESGFLSISNVSLLQSDAFTAEKIFEIRGTLILENSSLRGLTVPLIWLFGIGKLFQVEISNIRATAILIRSGKATLDLFSVSGSRLIYGLVASGYMEFFQTSSTISVTDSRFEDNPYWPIFAFDKGSTDIRIISSSFTHSGVVLEGANSPQKMIMQNCFFRDAICSSVVVKQISQAEIHIVNCTFINGADMAIFVSEFSGLVVLEDSIVTRQRGAGVLSAWNAWMDIPACQVVIRNSHMADINTTADWLVRASVISSSFCTIHISNLTIANATIAGTRSSNIYSNIVFGLFSELRISNLTVLDSGADLAMMNFHYSTVYLTDLLVDNLYIGVALYFLGGSHLYLRNTDIRRITAVVFLDEVTLMMLRPMYFGSFLSNVEIQNVSVSDSIELMGPLFSFAFSNYSISNIRLSHLPIQSVLLSSLSSGYIFDIHIDRVTADMHLFQASYGVTTISNVTFTNSQLNDKSGLVLIGNTNATLGNFVLVNSSMEAFIICSESRIAAVHLTLEKCVFKWLICNIVHSVVSIERLDLQQSTIRRLAVTSSSLAIGDSVFTSLYSQDVFFDIVSSNVSLMGLSAINISSVRELGIIARGSRLTVERNAFKELRVMRELGWQISESTLNVSYSRFISFNFGLFQAEQSNITFLNSTFANGNNPVQSLKSVAAFGGVLSCVNCPIIDIEGTRFFNVCSKIGGALAAMRSSYYTQELYLHVMQSEFIGCKAQQAGAIFLQNTSFTIESTVFMLNQAKERGGGIYAAIKPWQSGDIRNSRFEKNSASEGGAVKWSNAPVMLTNVTFHENSAMYGADMASYGISLSSNLTHLTGNESSGYPLRVIFELLDHYGNRVRLSSFQTLVLLSTPAISYRGNNSTFLNLGLFNFSELTVYAPPASTQTIKGILHDSQEDFDVNMVGLVLLDFRSCLSGEIQRSDRCDYCSPGFYSFSPRDANCSFCVENAFCPGGNRLEVDSGYWRSAWNSSQVVSCPFPAKCMGGNNSTCLSGFTGMLCNQCVQNTTRVRAMECVECTVVLVVVQICAPMLMLLLLRSAILKICVYHVSPNKLFVVKVVMTHFQYLSILCFLRVSYSEAITWSLHAVNWFSTLLISDLPLACLGISHPEYTKALIGSLILPTLLLLMVPLYFLRSTGFQRYSIPVLTSSLFYYMPYITLMTTIPVLLCLEVSRSSSLLFLDMSETCWEGLHLKYVRALVLPSLLLNVGGPVAALLWFRLARPIFFYRYFPLWIAGLKFKLYSLFEKSVEYFFLCVVIMTTTFEPLLQVTYILIPLIVICTVNATLHKWMFTSDKHFLLTEASLLTVALSVGFLSYYVFYLPGQGGSEYFVNAALALLNVAFLILCVWSFESNWLAAEEVEKHIPILAPPNTPIDSLEPSVLKQQ